MKKSISLLFLITLVTMVVTLGSNNKVKALDFASDYFTTENVEITPNKTVPSNLGLTDYRYGMLLSSSKENSAQRSASLDIHCIINEILPSFLNDISENITMANLGFARFKN